MTLVGLLLNRDSLATYFSYVSLLNEWCKESFLEMNAGKTKELVLDARKPTNVFVPVKLHNNEPGEMVSFSNNTDHMCKTNKQTNHSNAFTPCEK